MEGRRKLVNDKTRYSNRLTACLKMYFPQVLEWFSEVSSQITGDFLERWPTLQKLQKARPDTLRTFFIQHHSCTSENINRRLEEIRRAVPATHDPAVITSGVSAALAVVRLLRDWPLISVCTNVALATSGDLHVPPACATTRFSTRFWDPGCKFELVVNGSC